VTITRNKSKKPSIFLNRTINTLVPGQTCTRTITFNQLRVMIVNQCYTGHQDYYVKTLNTAAQDEFIIITYALWQPKFIQFLYGLALQIPYNNSVRTSHETHYGSATKANRLMCLGNIRYQETAVEDTEGWRDSVQQWFITCGDQRRCCNYL
jgi:hypothetical protein